MSPSGFTATDRLQLERRGIGEEEAAAQVARLRNPPGHVKLVRPCTPGDGIETLTDSRVEALQQIHAAAAEAGRVSKFVPASGAATRMFQELLWFTSGGGQGRSWDSLVTEAASSPGGEAAVVVSFLEQLDRFPFVEDLDWVFRSRGESLATLRREHHVGQLLDGLLGENGLNYARLPKGLLKFHGYPDGARTSFEEHLIEGADHARGPGGRCRLHFTVSPGHEQAFRLKLAEVRDRHSTRLGVTFDVDWSHQDPATDTLAIDAAGEPVHDAAGRLLFRPGGHGALIRNLQRIDGDIVFLKNIDNVQPDRVKPTALRWKRALAGFLVELQDRAAKAIQRMQHAEGRAELGQSLADVGATVHVALNGQPDPAAARDELVGQLDRPLRVCGVVRNTGEPGGGPFWVRGADGVIGVQIVESAQVDPDDAEQQAIFRSSTHFNPVDLVCGLRRPGGGEAYNLAKYIDADAVIVTQKSLAGAPITVLERPGLWNGAMAHWNTVFVEVPLETFSPVKTVMDLLRPEHR